MTWEALAVVISVDVVLFWLGFECGIKNEQAVRREREEMYKRQIEAKRKELL